MASRFAKFPSRLFPDITREDTDDVVSWTGLDSYIWPTQQAVLAVSGSGDVVAPPAPEVHSDLVERLEKAKLVLSALPTDLCGV